MKKLLILLSSLFIFSCEAKKETTYPLYELISRDIVPDSLLPKKQKFILECIKNSNYHMTGGDYERPDYTISECENVADRMFSKKVLGLYMQETPGSMYEYINPSDFTEKQKIIFQKLCDSNHQ